MDRAVRSAQMRRGGANALGPQGLGAIALLMLILATAPVEARIIDPFDPRLEETRPLRGAVEVFRTEGGRLGGGPAASDAVKPDGRAATDAAVPADASAPSEPVPPKGEEGWMRPRPARSGLGDLWFLESQLVWYRVALPDDLMPRDMLSVNVPGELRSIYVDERRVGKEEASHTLAFLSLGAELLDGGEYLYIGVAHPMEHIRHVLRGPEGSHAGELKRYSGFRRVIPPPVRVETAIFSKRQPGELTWKPLSSNYMHGRQGSSFAVRFTLPDRFRDEGLTILHQVAPDGIEVLIDGELYYGWRRGVGGRTGPAAAYRTPSVTVVPLPDARLGEVQLRWHFPNRLALRNNFLDWQATIGHLGFSAGSAEEMILAQEMGWGFQQTHFIPAVALALLALALFVLGFARAGRGKRTFFLLGGLILSGIGAYLGNQMDNVVHLIPGLRSLGFSASYTLFFICLYAVPPFLLFFFYSSTETAVPERQGRAAGILVATAVLFSLVQIAILLLGDIENFVIWEMGPVGLITYLLEWIAAISLIIIHARQSKERQIIRYLLVFAGLLLLNGLFQIGAGAAPWIEMEVLTFVRLRSALFVASVVPLLAIPIIVYRRVERGLEEANVVFRRFVPDEFLRFLGIRELNQIRPGQQIETELTVMFCDIRGFTSLAERMQPAGVMGFVNSYLEMAGPVIRRHGGFVDKYLGDGIMALFPGEGGSGCRAALEIAGGMERLGGPEPVGAGIGLHTGPAMLGTVGEHDRLDTTVISDAVNTASRLQSLSAHYSCSILVSEAAAGGGEQEPRAESGYYVRFVDEVRLKGKGRPVKIYEVRGGEADEAQRSVDELYRRAFEALALREADAARELLERCLAAAPEDPVYGTLALRIERFRRNGFPEDWDGVTNHAFK